MESMQRCLVLLAVLLNVIHASAAQISDEPAVLNAQLYTSYKEITPELEFSVVAVVNIHSGLHINSNNPNEEYLIPTILKFTSQSALSIGEIVYPKPIFKEFSFSTNPLSVYEGNTKIYATLQASPDVKPGVYELEGSLSFQGCNDNSCFAPGEVKLKANLTVVPKGTAISSSNDELFQQALTTPSASEKPQFTDDENRAMRILEHGIIYALLAFFLIGLALNLTPCVYPIIPLTVSYFAGQSDRTRGSIFITAFFYLIGIATSFAFLGVLSGLAGRQWGFLFQSPWFVVVIATIIILMAASMFGAFEITVPSSLLTKLGGARQGLLGALVMGLTVGVIIAPCAAGIIIGLVGLIAKMGLVFKGGLLFFAMGLGLGLPYLILATFSGLLNQLPQSGMWMIWIKKVFGILLIGVAIYFIVPQIEHIYDKLGFLLGILAISGGLLLGFLEHGAGYTKGFKWFRWITGVLLIFLGLTMTHNAIQSKPTTLPWIHYSNQSVAEITQPGKPIFIDFYADWCAPCKQLETKTFSDAKVVDAFKAFTLIKVDCTKPNETTQSFMNQLQVTGMPTLLFLTAKGTELKELREVGFVSADNFLKSLTTALQNKQ